MANLIVSQSYTMSRSVARRRDSAVFSLFLYGTIKHSTQQKRLAKGRA